VKLVTILLLMLAGNQAVPAARAQSSPLVPSARLDRSRAFEQALHRPAPDMMMAPQAKSRYKAALLSALVPGLGEAYAGHNVRAIAFGTAEAGIWVTYGVFRMQEDLRHDRAVELAVAAAGASPAGDEEYYKAVGRFLRSDGPGMWNEFVRRRLRDTGERIGVEYGGSDAWAWTSQANLDAYRDLRRRELSAEDNATNMFAFAILNRVLSVIDAVYIVNRDQHAAETQGFSLEFDTGGSTMARVMLQNRF
jgi:hypothetical protein